MKYEEAIVIAERTLEELKPHCYRCEIAGSVRRKKPEVKDIEIVAWPKPYDFGLLESGIVELVSKWRVVKGRFPCKYTQRILPEGIKLDLFFADKYNWGNTYAIRTGSADYSHYVLATGWVKKGYKSAGGYLYRNKKGCNEFTRIVLKSEWENKYKCKEDYLFQRRLPLLKPIYEEQDLFNLIGIPYVEPENRMPYFYKTEKKNYENYGDYVDYEGLMNQLNNR